MNKNPNFKSNVGEHDTSNLPKNAKKSSPSDRGLAIGLGIVLVIIILIVVAIIIAVIIISHISKVTISSGNISIWGKVSGSSSDQSSVITSSFGGGTYSGNMSQLVSDLNTTFTVNLPGQDGKAQIASANYSEDSGRLTISLESGYDYVYLSASNIFPRIGLPASFYLYRTGGPGGTTITSITGCQFGEELAINPGSGGNGNGNSNGNNNNS